MIFVNFLYPGDYAQTQPQISCCPTMKRAADMFSTASRDFSQVHLMGMHEPYPVSFCPFCGESIEVVVVDLRSRSRW